MKKFLQIILIGVVFGCTKKIHTKDGVITLNTLALEEREISRTKLQERTVEDRVHCTYVGYCMGVGFNGTYGFGLSVACSGSRLAKINIVNFSIIKSYTSNDKIYFALPEEVEERKIIKYITECY